MNLIKKIQKNYQGKKNNYNNNKNNKNQYNWNKNNNIILIRN